MKILAFAASSSKHSINKQLITYATDLILSSNPAASVDIIDINDYEMPLFSIDREAELGQPEQAKEFFKKIGEADALVISFAEHNGSYTAAYKNLFDWTSRIDAKVFQDKPMVLLATSPGKGGARSVLNSAETSAPHFGGQLKASLSIASFYDNFDNEKKMLSNFDIDQQLQNVLTELG